MLILSTMKTFITPHPPYTSAARTWRAPQKGIHRTPLLGLRVDTNGVFPRDNVLSSDLSDHVFVMISNRSLVDLTSSTV